MIDRLSRKRAALLVIDVQERLLGAMPDGVAATLVRNTGILVEAAARLGLPIVASQQYPKGLGQTVSDLAAALAAAAQAGAEVHRFDKLEFSAAASPLPVRGRDQWIVAGIEAHVCVYQTVRDLARGGGAVHVAADATASRTKANWRIGLDLCAKAGATVSSTEVCVFDLLERAGSDEFKALSKLIK